MKTHLLAILLAAGLPLPAFATQAYGSLNNFDVVNDTGHECHGFEIELEDVHSADITYTYDWNHYGAPTITEDNSDPLHSRVFVRYEAHRSGDGSWSAYTAIPAGPVAPTDGHQFVDPSVNFGGEHFGVGFYGIPGAVKYFWLYDDGSGTLVRGPQVDIATPAFAYVPPQRPGDAPQVHMEIEAPEEEFHFGEFGPAQWVKVITTKTHSEDRVELADLVSDDPDDPTDRNWRNGQESEVETEWKLMQMDYTRDDGGKNGALENDPQELGDEDEVVTVRYEFFKYTGPVDPENEEALAEDVAADGIHGVGVVESEEGGEIDLSQVEVVGEYIGAQMAGFDAAGQIGLIDHLQDAAVDEPYVERRVVVQGTPPINTTVEGALPQGMALNFAEGILSGTPVEAGDFSFTVHAVDAVGGDVSKEYTLHVNTAEAEGQVEGSLEGAPEGVVEGSGEGTVEGNVEGTLEGSLEGSVEGIVEGSVEGSAEGSQEGSVEGSAEGSAEGLAEGAIEGDTEGQVGEGEEGELAELEELLDRFHELDQDEDHLELEEAQAALPGLTPQQFAAFDTNGDGRLNVAELLAAAGANVVIHGGDTDGDHAITLGETLRVIQLYNAGAYSCAAHPGDTEDGYEAGEDGDACTLAHAADYEGGAPDGVIGLSELLRVIQLFTTGGYHYCPLDATEDGFCAGL